MKHKAELLAPAGDWESFLAAVENGADAVYLGGKLFNARQFAGNFDNEKLKKALDYAHVRDVNIYLTINTLISDDEMREALSFTKEAYLMGVDGIIVQDVGFAAAVRRLLPDLPLHASTQMTVYNLDGVKFLENMGFKRVVLARELSLDEIKYIAENTSMEIEIFIHGALCISYSGQCLMSSIIGGRSGNRGRCAQPCRLPYRIAGKEDNPPRFLLSPKDLCSIELMDEILTSGVKSFKIEGRMKSPEYVATVVGIYRKYLDRFYDDFYAAKQLSVDKKDMNDLMQIFNRGGFSSGYLKGKSGRDMMCFEKPKNWGVYLGEIISYDKNEKTAVIKLDNGLSIGDGIEVWNGAEQSPGTIVTEIRANGKNTADVSPGQVVTVGRLTGRLFKGNKVYKTSQKRLNVVARDSFEGKAKRKVLLSGRILIKKGKPVVFICSDSKGNEVEECTDTVAETAINKSLTPDKVKEQLNKTGNTPFEFKEIEVEIDEGLSVPISEINSIRRKALEQMEQKKALKYSRKLSDDDVEIKEELLNFPGNSRIESDNVLSQKPYISLLVYRADTQTDYFSLKADRLYLPFDFLTNEKTAGEIMKKRCKETEVFAWLPQITRGNYESIIEPGLESLIRRGIDGILVGNIGQLIYAEEFPGLRVMGDYSLNLFNSFTLDEMKKYKLYGVTLSLELTLRQIEGMRCEEGLWRESIVYGRIPLMVTEYCPIGSSVEKGNKYISCNGMCKRQNFSLKDRMGLEFPVDMEILDCRSMILNSNVMFIPDTLYKLRKSGIDTMRLYMFDETGEEMKKIIDIYREAAYNGPGILQKYDSFVEDIKARGFNKGHYFRGV